MIKMRRIASFFLLILIIFPFGSVRAAASNWGMLGSGQGEFNNPLGLDVDVQGNVYVADTENHRIQVFDTRGNYLSAWGIKGAGNGRLSTPADVAVSVSGYVYVADSGNNRFQVFHSDGTFADSFGRAGSGEGEFLHPASIDVNDSTSKIYVADSGNNRIQFFGTSGFENKWGSRGSGPGELLNPSGIAVGPDGSVYVADTGNHRVQQFTANGVFVRSWGRFGNGKAEFFSPTGIAVDPYGHVYVSDTGNHRVQQFSANGDFLKVWGGLGSGEGQFNSPAGLAATSDGLAFVADTKLQRVQKLRIDYPPVATIVRVTGSVTVGQTVYGEYQFGDQDGDLEGKSTYRWYRSTDEVGSNAVVIPGAERSMYTLQPADEGSYIAFEVTPMSDRGAMQGKPTKSSFIGPVSEVVNHAPIRNYELADHTITMNGPTFSQDVHDWFTDPDGDLLVWSIQIDHPEVVDAVLGGMTLSITPKSEGSAVVTVTVSDGNGGTADGRFIVRVSPASSGGIPPTDSMAPVIMLIGEATIILHVGDTFNDPGVTVIDDTYGDLTSQVVVGGDHVDTSKAGTYVVTYNVSGPAGNAAQQIIRTVIVENAYALAEPKNLIAVSGDRRVTLSWVTVTGATYYNIYMAEDMGQLGRNVVGTVTGTTYSINNLVNGTTYYFVVKAGNPRSSSPQSNVASATVNPSTGPVTAITVTGAGNATTIIAGSTLQMTAIIAPANAIQDVTWSVVNGTGSATINSAGLLTGINGGTVTVKATAADGSSLSGTCIITVLARSNTVPVTSISITASKTTLAVGDQVQLSATVFPANATNKAVIWSVTPGSGSATISSSGLLIATQSGTVTVVATAADGSHVVGSETINVLASPKNGRGSGSSGGTAQMTTSTSTPTPTADPTSSSAPTTEHLLTVTPGKPVIDFNDTRAVSTFKEMISKEMKTITSPAEFTDTANHWAAQNIKQFSKIGVVSGYSDGSFKPDANISRGEFVAMVAKVFVMAPGNVKSVSFPDVNDSWAKEAIMTLASNGIIDGYNDGTFRADINITREEMVVIIARIVNLSDVKVVDSVAFKDISSAWAKNQIEAAAKAGIINGQLDGFFFPEKNTTRAEALTVLLRTIKLSPEIAPLLESAK